MYFFLFYTKWTVMLEKVMYDGVFSFTTIWDTETAVWKLAVRRYIRFVEISGMVDNVSRNLRPGRYRLRKPVGIWILSR